jgi:pyruvate dehydrogenase E2 component (dihydrolipoamide acetyltransferase)
VKRSYSANGGGAAAGQGKQSGGGDASPSGSTAQATVESEDQVASKRGSDPHKTGTDRADGNGDRPYPRPPARPNVSARAGATAQRVLASPLARKVAEETGVDLSQIRGSGPGGRITQQDVLNFKPEPKQHAGAERSAAPAPTQTQKDQPAFSARMSRGETQTIAFNKMRQTIAQRLQQSTQQLPHFYETVDIDIEELMNARERLNKSLEKTGVRLSVGDFVAKAVAVSLQKHPNVNAHFNGQTSEVKQFADVHLGMAVALENGLIVPVLRNIDQMGLVEIRQRSADLVDRARQQKLKQDELTGATFTVSNLGTHGIKHFTAIINPPEVGILAVGAAEKRAVVRDNQIVARWILSVTMSSDHRVVDGAAAADFLRTLRGLLEDPAMMLV